MAFPTSPTDGDIYVKGSTPYVYASANNSWTKTTDANLVAGNIKSGVDILGVTGSHYSQLSNIYISALEQFKVITYTEGTSEMAYQYSVIIGDYIYVPFFINSNGLDPARIRAGMMKISIDGTALPLLTWYDYFTETSGNQGISSQYSDSGIIYFNSSASSKYHYYDTSDDTWTVKQAGSYTSGTQITAQSSLDGIQ